MSVLSSTPSTRSIKCSVLSTKMASTGGKKAAHIVDPVNREEHLKRIAEAGIGVARQEMKDTGQLEVVPWTDAFGRDRRRRE